MFTVGWTRRGELEQTWIRENIRSLAGGDISSVHRYGGGADINSGVWGWYTVIQSGPAIDPPEYCCRTTLAAPGYSQRGNNTRWRRAAPAHREGVQGIITTSLPPHHPPEYE